jgi:hypothetical protein
MEKPGIAKDIMDSLPYGMIDGTLLTIEAISGFEKFNNRPSVPLLRDVVSGLADH